MAERTDRLSMRMPPEVIERLRQAAKKDRRTVTAAVEKAIDLYVEHVEADQGKAAA